MLLTRRFSGKSTISSRPGYAVFLSFSAISRLLRRNKAISDGVSIRGAGEIPSFRLSEAVEGVTESLLPPIFKVFAMFLPQFFQLIGI